MKKRNLESNKEVSKIIEKLQTVLSYYSYKPYKRDLKLLSEELKMWGFEIVLDTGEIQVIHFNKAENKSAGPRITFSDGTMMSAKKLSQRISSKQIQVHPRQFNRKKLCF